MLPAQYESYRSQIEAVLPPIHLPVPGRGHRPSAARPEAPKM